MRVVKHLTAVALLILLSSCGTATTPCGAFTFTGSSIANGGINVFPAMSALP